MQVYYNTPSSIEIHIKADAEGHVGWGLEAIHLTNKENDADCEYIISVINKLRTLMSELETVYQATE